MEPRLNCHTAGNIASINNTWIADRTRLVISTALGRLKVTGSHVQTYSGNISETVQDRDIVTIVHVWFRAAD